MDADKVNKLLGIGAPSKGGGGRRTSGGGGGGTVSAGWVTELQAKIKEKYSDVDLGGTGPKGDGVDGIYGNKTKNAVREVAKREGITDPFDSSGKPSAEFNKKLGLTGGSPDSGKKEEEKKVDPLKPLPEIMREVNVGGVEFDIDAFLAALPPEMTASRVDSMETYLDPEEAGARIVQIGRAVVAGGMKLSTTFPQGLTTLANPVKREMYAKALLTHVDDIASNLKQIGTAIQGEIKRKRAEMGLKGDYAVGRQQDQAYDYEAAYYHLGTNVRAGLETAYKSFYRYVTGTGKKQEQTEPKSLLDVIKRNTQALTGIPKENLTRDHAMAVGKFLMSTNTDIGKRILSQDPSQYFANNHNSKRINDEWIAAVSSNAAALEKVIKDVK